MTVCATVGIMLGVRAHPLWNASIVDKCLHWQSNVHSFTMEASSVENSRAVYNWRRIVRG